MKCKIVYKDGTLNKVIRAIDYEETDHFVVIKTTDEKTIKIGKQAIISIIEVD